MKQGVIKLQAPFDGIRLLDYKPEVKLYKAIIMQAIIDASNNSDNEEAKRLEKEAKDWIFNDSEWFFEVCDQAKLEIKTVRKSAELAIQHNKRKLDIQKKSDVNQIKELTDQNIILTIQPTKMLLV